MVTISFKTGNDAFRNEVGDLDLKEVRDTIKAIADVIAFGMEEGTIRDRYGNPVGTFKVED